MANDTPDILKRILARKAEEITERSQRVSMRELGSRIEDMPAPRPFADALRARVAKGDAAVIFDFARYRKSSIDAAQALSDLSVTLIAITDGPMSPLAAMTENWCALTIPPVGPFDSSLPAVLTAELVVSRVVQLLGNSAKKRIDRLESLWQATDTFV